MPQVPAQSSESAVVTSIFVGPSNTKETITVVVPNPTPAQSSDSTVVTSVIVGPSNTQETITVVVHNPTAVPNVPQTRSPSSHLQIIIPVVAISCLALVVIVGLLLLSRRRHRRAENQYAPPGESTPDDLEPYTLPPSYAQAVPSYIAEPPATRPTTKFGSTVYSGSRHGEGSSRLSVVSGPTKVG